MQLTEPSTIDRAALRMWYLTNRNRTAEIFAIPEPEAYFDRPIGLRNPIAFYDGHIPNFTYLKLNREGLGAPAIDPAFEKLFERGIDPESEREAAALGDTAWPERQRIAAYGAAIDAAVLQAFAKADLTDASASPSLVRAEAVYNILEHEEMHHETLLYMLHRLPFERKRSRGRTGSFVERAPLATGRVTIPAGIATLGARRDAIRFGWDNEFDEHHIEVGAFEIDVNDVTNGEWLEFVGVGGPIPSFWIAREDGFRLLGMFEEMPLPLTWPVYVTQAQASAYAAWKGARLPTEPEYHRAAYGTPDGAERAHPWGDVTPSSEFGNFDFKRFDPEPVGQYAAGASAFGVYDLVGNGWEWTSTLWGPFAGFSPMVTYPIYSNSFFDGQHYVIKGASPVTSRNLIRRSLRNWFRPEYPYLYATFRTVRS